MINFNDKRKIKKQVAIRDVIIGGRYDIAVQSMTNTDTKNTEATVLQIKQLEYAGCDIVRVSVYDKQCAQNIPAIKKACKIPIVADIHYDYNLAILSIEKGIDKIRINPGNIGSEKDVQSVLKYAKRYNVPIRIGVNTGSLPNHLYELYGGPTVGAVLHAINDQIDMMHKYDFDNIVLAAKSSDAMQTVEIYRALNEKYDYPLHVGVTESGTLVKGAVKSSAAFSLLLNEGITDTMRISLTDDPVKEIQVAHDILSATNVKKYGVNIISCPTCARTRIDIIKIADLVEQGTKHIKKNINIAIMGCRVNGINEAKYADIGIAGGDKKAVIFRKGEIIKTVDESEILEKLLEELEKC